MCIFSGLLPTFLDNLQFDNKHKTYSSSVVCALMRTLKGKPDALALNLRRLRVAFVLVTFVLTDSFRGPS